MFTEIDSVAGPVVHDDLLHAFADGFMPSQIAQAYFSDCLVYKRLCPPICESVQPLLKYILAVPCDVGFDFFRNRFPHTLSPSVANWLRPVKGFKARLYRKQTVARDSSRSLPSTASLYFEQFRENRVQDGFFSGPGLPTTFRNVGGAIYRALLCAVTGISLQRMEPSRAESLSS